MNFQTMSKQRKMILLAAAVGVIAMFLPWFSFSFGPFGGGSINGMHGWGIVVFLCFLGAGALTLMGDQTKNLEPMYWFLALIAGGLASLIMLVNLINASGSLGYLGIGFYGALLASFGVVAMAYMHRSAGDSLQRGYEKLRSSFNNPAEATNADTPGNTKVINPATDTNKQDV
ncbi:MAG TPA: hypothetical protein VGN63_01930 [Flavisolibacter sp.]|jgi:peptidoglycan/LPS O-acetylase OafA/YrhL|nr:hypothetical protein [Flavisolibacter sp.]